MSRWSDTHPYRPSIVYRNPEGHIGPQADPWSRLLYFQTTPLLAQRYQARHGAAIATEVSTEISAHLAQARDYFHSASVAGDLTRPLLLYYGSLALSRAAILFLSSPSVELPFTPSHGIRAKNLPIIDEAPWPGQEARVSSQILDYGIEITKKGTVPELIRALENRDWNMVEWVDSRQVYGLKRDQQYLTGWLGWISERPYEATTWSTSFGQVLARLPDLAHQYEEATGRVADCLPLKVTVYFGPFNMGPNVPPYPQGVSARLHRNMVPFYSTEEATNRFHIGIEKGLQPLGAFHDYQEFVMKLSRHERFQDLLPDLRNNRSMGTFAVAPFEHERHVATIPTMLIAAFCLGMIVRYHPTMWHSANSLERGDVALPLLREVTRMLIERFPLEIVEVMERADPAPGELLELPTGDIV